MSPSGQCRWPRDIAVVFLVFAANLRLVGGAGGADAPAVSEATYAAAASAARELCGGKTSEAVTTTGALRELEQCALALQKSRELAKVQKHVSREANEHYVDAFKGAFSVLKRFATLVNLEKAWNSDQGKAVNYLLGKANTLDGIVDKLGGEGWRNGLTTEMSPPSRLPPDDLEEGLEEGDTAFVEHTPDAQVAKESPKSGQAAVQKTGLINRTNPPILPEPSLPLEEPGYGGGALKPPQRSPSAADEDGIAAELERIEEPNPAQEEDGSATVPEGIDELNPDVELREPVLDSPGEQDSPWLPGL